MSLDIDFSDFFENTELIQERVDKNVEQVMQDVLDDLVRISSNIAPIDTGTLRKSHSQKLDKRRGKLIGEVAYTAIQESANYGMFNYALWTHEMDYTPSEEGSYEGYEIGNKYLSRPLYGESEKYFTWYTEAVLKGVDGKT